MNQLRSPLDQPSRPSSEVVVGLLVFLSGLAALTHQLLWTRRLMDLLGASTESTARVFGTFFLGLSIGSALAALMVGRVRQPLRLAAMVQLSIPLLSIPVIYLPEWTDWIWPVIGAESTFGWSGNAIKLLVTLGCVIPPSTMMGLSFPLIVAGVLQRNDGELGRSGINLYAINTLGGACGVLFAVMVAVPELGNFGSMVLAAGTDGMVGVALLVCAWAFGRSHVAPEQRVAGSQSNVGNSSRGGAPGRRLTNAVVLAFFSGMAVLALEVAAFQMLQLVATISVFTPAAVLFCAIASLGISAALFSRFGSAFLAKTNGQAVVYALAASGILVVLAPQIFMAIAQRSNWFAENDGVYPFVLKLGTLAFLSVGPAWLIAGLIFPSAVSLAGQQCSPVRAGQRLGMLLAVNGIGGLLGAELTYRYVLPAFGVYGAMAVVGLGLALIASVLALRQDRRTVGRSGVVWTSVSAVVVIAMLRFNADLPVVNPPPGIRPIDVRTGREGTVAVVEDPRGERSILVANQYVLGGTAVRYNQERQALLPLVLHDRPSEVGCIGLATGITPGAALSIGSVSQVTAIELSPIVARAAAIYFRDFNHNICGHDSASVLIGDGRTFMASVKDRFDVVTGDLFLPWAPGTARLYSREHFASVRRALRSGGIFCQWLPMYQLTPEQFRRIADTFAGEFEEPHFFMNHFSVSSPMLALVGGTEPGWLEWDRVAGRCDRLRESNTILDPVLRHDSGIRLLYLGRWPKTGGDSTPMSLADPSLEYSAATVRLSENPGNRYFSPANWIRFCRSRRASRPGDSGSESSSDTSLMMLATGLLELDYARRNEHRLADAIALRVSRTLPHCFAEDHSADMKRWPGPAVVRQMGPPGDR